MKIQFLVFLLVSNHQSHVDLLVYLLPNVHLLIRNQNKEAAHTRSDSGLSEAATECGCDSPIPSSQVPKAAAPSSDVRKVRSVRREDILEVFHADARLREVRRPRGQKLQSPLD